MIAFHWSSGVTCQKICISFDIVCGFGLLQLHFTVAFSWFNTASRELKKSVTVKSVKSSKSIKNESSNAVVKAWLHERGLSAAVSEFQGKITNLLSQCILISKRYSTL